MKKFFKPFQSPVPKSSVSEDPPPTYVAPNGNALTVIELFQSQGCSSCPPANANLLRLAEDPNLLILTYEVTYWDHLGWKDTFGNSAFDARQWEYSRGLNRKSVFTPQVIVNGHIDGVGNNSKDLQSMIARGTEGVSGDLAVEAVSGSILVAGPEGRKGVVLMMRYDPRVIDVDIPRGENGGRNLPHRNVVRDVTQLGFWHGGSQTFSLPKSENGNLKVAVLVQASSGGPILGAARI